MKNTMKKLTALAAASALTLSLAACGGDTVATAQPSGESAAPTETFPVTIVTSLEQDGNILPGASVPQQFQSSSESSPQSFTVLLPVTTAPTTLQVVGEGGSYLANSMALNVTRLGDVPAP